MTWSTGFSICTRGQVHLPGLWDHTRGTETPGCRNHRQRLSPGVVGLWLGVEGSGPEGSRCATPRSLSPDHCRQRGTTRNMPPWEGQDLQLREAGRTREKEASCVPQTGEGGRGITPLSFPEQLSFRGVNWTWPCRAISHAGGSCQPANPAACALPAVRVSSVTVSRVQAPLQRSWPGSL